jgi:uncharacterized protein YukE
MGKWISTLSRRLVAGCDGPEDRRARARKPLQPDAMSCEALEGRLVLSSSGLGGFVTAGLPMSGLGAGVMTASNMVGDFTMTRPQLGGHDVLAFAPGNLSGGLTVAGVQGGGPDVATLNPGNLSGGLSAAGSRMARFDVVAPPSGDFALATPALRMGGPDVVAFPSSGLVGSLTSIGVIAGLEPGGLRAVDGSSLDGASDQDSPLATALDKLSSDLQAIAAKSGVTLNDLRDLLADERAIAEAGFRPDATALQDAVGKLATAVASGADTGEAQAAFNALFADSSVGQETIDKAFADLVQTIQNSHVTADDLQTIADDRQAVQTALESLDRERAGTSPSGPGGSLLGTLADLGIVGDGLGYAFGAPSGHPLADPTGSLPSESATSIDTDMTRLRDDLEAVSAKSGVTVAGLKGLAADERAIAQASTPPDAAALQDALKALATAVADGADTAQAKADFAAAFAGSGVAQETVDQAFNDVTQTIQDSHITADELQSIADGRQAVQDELSSLPQASKTGGPGDIVSNSGGVQSGARTVTTFAPSTSSRHPRGAAGRFGAGRIRLSGLATRRAR